MPLRRRHLALSVSVLGAACLRSSSERGGSADAAPDAEIAAVAPEALDPDSSDLEGIRARGELRILVRGDTAAQFLPRADQVALQDVEMAEAFARRLEVEPVLVVAKTYDELIPALLAGRGDMIAAGLTVTPERSKQVAFARSTFAVKEMLVARKDLRSAPAGPEDLAGREVHVRPSSSYTESLADIEGVKIVPVAEHLDTAEIISDVAAGKRPLTVADSHILAAVQAYEPNVVGLFPVSEDRQLAWAVRPGAEDLRAAIDRFRSARALVESLEVVSRGDLDQIRERGVLRVLTRNNPITYFLYRGRPVGFEYELAKMLADELDLRLQMVVPPRRDQLIPWLIEGRGDLIAASLTVTPDRAERIAFSTPYQYVDEVVVGPEAAPDLDRLSALAGRPVHVRRSSSYWTTLRHVSEQGIAVRAVAAPEAWETERLIHEVAATDLPFTVADTHLLDVERAYGVGARAVLELPPGPVVDIPPPPRADEDRGAKPLAYGLRRDNPKLKAKVDAFVARTYRGLEYNVFRKRYFEDRRRIREFKDARADRTKRLSPFDDVIRKYARRYQLDWRLLAAQAYVESGFDPDAKSWVGAKGLFQVMPATGRSLGFSRLEDPEQGTHAGVKYVARLLGRFDPELPFAERVWFSLAAYNAGLGHVYDARRLAVKLGLNKDKWFGHVEKAMLRLAEPKYARRARHGYCRGEEPVAYVAHIRDAYRAYLRAIGPPSSAEPTPRPAP